MNYSGLLDKDRWRDSFQVYGARQVWLIGVLGFVSGLPLLLTLSTLAARMVEDGLTKTAIGLFALVGLPYSLKFVWAPLIDTVRLPYLYRRLGRRRSWMVLCQCLVIAGIFGLGSADAGDGPLYYALWALALAFASASQDIVIDAYRVETLTKSELGAGAAMLVAGYRLGMLVAGAGALYVAAFWDWQSAYFVMAGFMVPGLAATLLGPEPAGPDEEVSPSGQTETGRPSHSTRLLAWLHRAVVAPFRDFMQRDGWIWILVFIAIYKLGDGLAGIMAIPFYLELGFSKSEIASVSKIFGLLATLLGGFIGGLFVARFHIYTALLVAGIGQMLSNLLFACQAAIGADIWFLTLTVGIENLTGGIGTAAFVAYLSGLCARAYTAVQYALLSALMSVTRTTLSAPGGWLADETSWIVYFMLTTIAALPGLILVYWLKRHYGDA